MIDVSEPETGSDEALQICVTCQHAWLGRGHHMAESGAYQIAKPNVLGESASHQSREKFAEAMYKIAKADRDGASKEAGTYTGRNEVLAALFLLPVREDEDEGASIAWLTWLLVAAMVVATVVLGTSRGVFRDYGVVPRHLFKYGGLTLLTSFFVHAGFVHIIANAYMLLSFGCSVERAIGPRRFLALVFLSHLAGMFLHCLFDPRGLLPVVGASAGISGVLVYFALRFPAQRVIINVMYAYRLRFFFTTLLVVWFTGQVISGILQTRGIGTVSALGHLGGIGVGIGFWFIQKRRVRRRQ